MPAFFFKGWIKRGLPLLLVLMCSGCATSYKRAWKSYADATPGNAFTGRWQGSWVSRHNGHRGGLRAMIDHIEGDRYDARFYATYAKLLQFTHANVFTVQREGDLITFSGENDLGKLAGGLFRYTGKVDGDDFAAVYRAEVDHGVFTMKRVGDEK